jgi:hypothetical protein
MNAGVPITAPGIVNAVAASSGRAIPKSVMTVRVPASRMSPGFRSRHITPAACACLSASSSAAASRGLDDGDQPSIAQVRAQGRAIDVLHDNRWQTVPIDDVVDPHDTWAIEPGRHLRFTSSSSDLPGPNLGHSCVRRREQPDRHDPIKLLVPRLPNLAHRALTHLADEPAVPADQIIIRPLLHAPTLRGSRCSVARFAVPRPSAYDYLRRAQGTEPTRTVARGCSVLAA